MANRYVFNTSLIGYVNVFEDSGHFNNRSFGYTIPSDALQQIREDRAELLTWARSKADRRTQEAIEPWDEAGVARYTYGKGDGSRKPKPDPVFVDVDGKPISPSVLKEVKQGTKVRLILDQRPYVMGHHIGTSLKVQAVEIVELESGRSDNPQGLSLEEVVVIFRKEPRE